MPCFIHKGAIFFGLGVKGTVVEGGLDGEPLGQEAGHGRTEEDAAHTLVDIGHGLGAGMQHILSVETVVAQFVVHNLVRGKITDTIKEALGLGGGQQQGRLGQLAAVEAVLLIAYGAHGEDDTHLWPTVAQLADGVAETVGNFLYGHRTFLEEILRAFLAVVDHLAGGAQYIDVVGAQGEYGHVDLVVTGQSVYQSLHGVAYADGVIHHAIGVDRYAETIVGKAAAHIVGKAAAHKEHAGAGLYLEVGLWQVDRCL